MFRFAGRDLLFGLMTAAALPAGGSAFAAGIHRGPSSRDAVSTQPPVVVTSSARVRIETVPDADHPEMLRGKFVGSLVGLNQSNLTMVLEDGQPAVIHRDLVEEFEVAVDHGSMGKHMLVGAGIGAVVGVALGLAAAGGGDPWDPDADQGAAIGTAFFAPIGAVIGALLPSGQGWKHVSMERVQWHPEAVSGGAVPGMNYE